MSLAALVLLAWAGAGCGAAGLKFYPVGLCGVASTNDLPLVRAAGFNLVLGAASRSYLDAANAAGLRVIASVGTAAGPELNPRVLRQQVSRWDDHPAVWAWLVADEPEMKGIPAKDVARAHRLVKSTGARKPTALVLWQGYEALDYGNIADITLSDRYPIPWLPLANFGQHLRMVRLALGKDKPLLAIVQAFDWAYYPESLSEDPVRMRPPTEAEMRCMTYRALSERANGLLYYVFDDGPGRWRMAEHLDTWRALCAVVREVESRRPLFQAEHLWWPKGQKYQDPARRFNAALESSITSVWLRVRRGNATVPPGDYVLCVNNTDQAHVFSFTPPRKSIDALTVFGENRTVAAAGGWVTDAFEPYAVHVYGPFVSR